MRINRLSPKFNFFSSPRFSGYSVNEKGVQFFLTGRQSAEKIELEYRVGNGNVKTLNMEPDNGQWILSDDVYIPNHDDIAYRFRKDGEIVTDYNRTVDGFNVIPANSKSPSGLGTTLLVFRDSVRSSEKLNQSDSFDKRTHFNQFGGAVESSDFISKLVRQFGIGVVEDRPLIGGDRLSSHGYWTTSIFQPNSRILTPSGFEKFLIESLRDGGRPCFDGAFVNEGLEGIHYLANMYYRHNSPFLRWFDYGQLNAFPDRQLKLGILPTKTDPLTGYENVNNEAWNIRIIKPVNLKSPETPCFIELYDPRLEDSLGRKLKSDHIQLRSSQDSVQNYRFPVSQKLAEKLEQISKIALSDKRAESIHRILSQESFGFVTRDEDNSGYNWDGQRDVKKLNMELPEVVDYIRNGTVYWTDRVDRIYTRHVAKALGEKLKNNNAVTAQKAYEAVNAITGKNLEDINSILPPLPQKGLNGVTDNPVSPESIQQALNNHKSFCKNQKLSAAAFVAQDLKHNFHLETLSVPTMMQIIFSTPRLKQLLQEGDTSLLLELFNGVFQPVFKWLDRFIPVSKPLQKLIKILTPDSFYSQLEHKLDKSLSAKLKERLQDPVMGHLFYEEIGRSIFLSILTGRFISPDADDRELDPKTLYRQFAQNLPVEVKASITDGTPDLAAKLLNRFMIRKLKSFRLEQINPVLERMLGNLSSESVAVARHVLHKRRFGLHWRIDALKDLGNMDAVRNSLDETRENLLFKEMAKVKQIMSAIASRKNGIRSVFPESVIKAEITDLHQFTTAKNENRILNELMQDNMINGIPNYTWFFASGHKAVRGAYKPESEGEVQLSPADFISKKLKPMMQAIPFNNALMFQNMTSNHDMSTSLYGLLLHPHQARYDYYPWLELNTRNPQERSLFYLALNELQHKPQLEFLKQDLPQACYEKLRKLSSCEDIINRLSLDIKPYFEPMDKREDPTTRRAVPLEIKGKFIDELFKLINPADLGISEKHHQQLHKALKSLILEPTEVKAMRGKLSNVFSQLCANPQPLADLLGGDHIKARSVLNELVPVFNRTLWNFTQDMPERDRRWSGYQQIDFIIEQVVKKLPDTSSINSSTRLALKQAIYNETIKPALEQYKRIVALQTAVPGDPAFYLPDLLGQAGGEDIKNMYLGNRELIRYDWLKTNPFIKQYFDELSLIISSRYKNSVLNNGHLELPLDPDRSEGEKNILTDSPVLPIIRDNGEDQAICLVNFAKPQDAWQSWMNSQTTPLYPEIDSQQPIVSNYMLDLKYLDIAPGTIYKSVDPESCGEEYYFVNDDHKLASQNNPEKGIDIKISRILMRV